MCGHRKRRTASLTVIHVRCDYLYFSNLCAQDPLYTLSADERGFLWQHRMELVRRPALRALPKFLLSVPWENLTARRSNIEYLLHVTANNLLIYYWHGKLTVLLP